MPIPICRALAIVLVVLFHAQKILAGSGLSHDAYGLALRPLGFILIQLFFLTAGLSMSRMARMHSGEFVRSRICNYLWLYVVWSLVYLATHAGGLIRGTIDPGSWLSDGAASILVPTGTLWFFHHLLLFVALTKVFSRQNRAAAVVAIVVLQVASSLFDLPLEERFFRMMLFFALGYLFSAEIADCFARPRIVLGLAALAAFGLIDATCLTWNADFSNHDQNSLIADVMSVLGIFWFVQIAHLLSKTPLAGILKRVGVHVLPIYLVHWLVLLILFKAAQLVFPYLDTRVASLFAPWLFGSLSLYLSMKAAEVWGRRPGLFVAPRWFIQVGSASMCRFRAEGRNIMTNMLRPAAR